MVKEKKFHTVSLCSALSAFLTLLRYSASMGCQRYLAGVTGAWAWISPPSLRFFFHSYLPNGNFLFNILAPLRSCWRQSFLVTRAEGSTYHRERGRSDRALQCEEYCVLPSLRSSSCRSYLPAQLQCGALPRGAMLAHTNSETQLHVVCKQGCGRCPMWSLRQDQRRPILIHLLNMHIGERC